MLKLPELTFRKGRRQPDWIDKKVNSYNRYWYANGKKLGRKAHRHNEKGIINKSNGKFILWEK